MNLSEVDESGISYETKLFIIGIVDEKVRLKNLLNHPVSTLKDSHTFIDQMNRYLTILDVINMFSNPMSLYATKYEAYMHKEK